MPTAAELDAQRVALVSQRDAIQSQITALVTRINRKENLTSQINQFEANGNRLLGLVAAGPAKTAAIANFAALLTELRNFLSE